MTRWVSALCAAWMTRRLAPQARKDRLHRGSGEVQSQFRGGSSRRFQGPGTTRWYDGEKRTVASQHSCSGAIVQDVWQMVQAAAVLVWVRALPSHGRARTALGLRQPVKEVSGSPFAKLSDSTGSLFFKTPPGEDSGSLSGSRRDAHGRSPGSWLPWGLRCAVSGLPG